MAEYETKIEGVKREMEAARSLSEGAASEKAELDRQHKDANKRLANLKGKRHALQVSRCRCCFPVYSVLLAPSRPRRPHSRTSPCCPPFATVDKGLQFEGQHHRVQKEAACKGVPAARACGEGPRQVGLFPGQWWWRLLFQCGTYVRVLPVLCAVMRHF